MKKNKKKRMIGSRFCIMLNTQFLLTTQQQKSKPPRKVHTKTIAQIKNQISKGQNREKHLTENHIARKSVDTNRKSFSVLRLICFSVVMIPDPSMLTSLFYWTCSIHSHRTFALNLFSIYSFFFTWQVETIKAVNSKEAVVAGSHDINHTKFIN